MPSTNFMFIIPAAAILAAAIIIKAILDNWGKYKYSRLSKEELSENYPQIVKTDPFSIIKWASILIGLGTALFISEIFFEDAPPGITFGLMFLFAAFGLIIYYLLLSKREKSGE